MKNFYSRIEFYLDHHILLYIVPFIEKNEYSKVKKKNAQPGCLKQLFFISEKKFIIFDIALHYKNLNVSIIVKIEFLSIYIK